MKNAKTPKGWHDNNATPSGFWVILGDFFYNPGTPSGLGQSFKREEKTK
jgi:hypothetical protein